MPLDLSNSFSQFTQPTTHRLAATPETVYWGYIDRDQPPCLTVNDGDIIEIEAITHHAGDAPDLLMDDGIREIWKAIPESTRGPGVHILTGPIHVRGAEPGDTLAVRILGMVPRLPYGSNLAANWGLLYDKFGKERVTIYGLDDVADGSFGSTASPSFAFDFTERPIYDLPGVLSEESNNPRQPFSRNVKVPVRPHFGVMGVAPQESGRLSSSPPSVFGGNVDNWRLGPGAALHLQLERPDAAQRGRRGLPYLRRVLRSQLPFFCLCRLDRAGHRLAAVGADGRQVKLDARRG